jgi:hypothetical protein
MTRCIECGYTHGTHGVGCPRSRQVPVSEQISGLGTAEMLTLGVMVLVVIAAMVGAFGGGSVSP